MSAVAEYRQAALFGFPADAYPDRRCRRPIAGYRLRPDEMTAAAASIGCRLAWPHLDRTTIFDPDPSTVLVTNNATETKWWQDIAACCTAVCCPLGRLLWKSSLQGQTVLYFGADKEAFTAAFRPFGFVLWYA